MAKDAEIIRKLSWILSRFPLEIDYKPAQNLTDKSAGLSLFTSVLDEYLWQRMPLGDLIWGRYTHYYGAPQTPWDFKYAVDWFEGEPVLTNSPSDPTKIPLCNLPDPDPTISGFNLRLFSERKSILTMIDFYLMTNPDLVFGRYPDDLYSVLQDPEVFRQAISVEPSLYDTEFGRSVRFSQPDQHTFLLPKRPVAGGFRRSGVKNPGFNRQSWITPFLRLLVVLKCYPNTISRSDFTISDFRAACLRVYFKNDKTQDSNVPSSEVLKPWFQYIFGKAVRPAPKDWKSDFNAHLPLPWPWEIPEIRSYKEDKRRRSIEKNEGFLEKLLST